MRRNKRVGLGKAVTFLEPYFGSESTHAKLTTNPESFHRAIKNRAKLLGLEECVAPLNQIKQNQGGAVPLGRTGRKQLIYISKETANRGPGNANVLVHELATTAMNRYRVLHKLKSHALISEIAGNIIEMDYLQRHHQMQYLHELTNEQWPRSLDAIAKNIAIETHRALSPEERRQLIVQLAGSTAQSLDEITEWVKKETQTLIAARRHH